MVQVLSLALFALLLARVIRAPRGTWRYILGAAALVLLASQLLPAGNAFRADVAGSSRTLFWLGLALIPVGAYAFVLRRLRARTGAGAGPPPHPTGLVQIARDQALAEDTRAALAAGTPAGLVGAPHSLGWRAADGALAGHLRFHLVGELAEIEMLHVDPARRGADIGTALLRAGEGAARERGAQRIGARVADWQAPGFFLRAGYAAGPAEALGGGRSRQWLEKALP